MSGLFEQIMDLGGLLRGWERVEENAGSAGYDRVSVEDFGERLDEELLVLADELERGAYRPLPLMQYAIPKRDGGKRILQVPAVRDRVAQSSALEVLAPRFEPEVLVFTGRMWMRISLSAVCLLPDCTPNNSPPSSPNSLPPESPP